MKNHYLQFKTRHVMKLQGIDLSLFSARNWNDKVILVTKIKPPTKAFEDNNLTLTLLKEYVYEVTKK